MIIKFMFSTPIYPEFKTHIVICSLDINTWISNAQIKLASPNRILDPPPQTCFCPSLLISVNTVIIHPVVHLQFFNFLHTQYLIHLPIFSVFPPKHTSNWFTSSRRHSYHLSLRQGLTNFFSKGPDFARFFS